MTSKVSKREKASQFVGWQDDGFKRQTYAKYRVPLHLSVKFELHTAHKTDIE